MIAHRVFCVSMVCSAVVIAPANAGPMNFLKVMVGDKKTTGSGNGTTRARTAPAGSVKFVAATVVLPPGGDVGVRVAMDVVPKRPAPVVGNDRGAGRVGRVNDDGGKSNSCDADNNAVFQRLCSAVLYAATMPQRRAESVDVTTAGGVFGPRQQSPAPPQRQSPPPPPTPPPQSMAVAAAPAERAHHYARKSFRKRFPAGDRGSGAREWFGPTTRPADRYRDPILAQETSRGVDYLTSYPLAKGGAEDEEKYYEDAERPAEVWKIKVVGEPMAKSSKSAAEDDDDDDDETAVADESR